MKAVATFGVRDVQVIEAPDPVVEDARDAVVRVTTGAICGSDLHIYHGRVDVEPGFVVGHEYVGVVEEVGPGVTLIEEGDRVVGSFFVACGDCWFCHKGLFNKCLGVRIFGFGMALGDLPGSQAEKVLVPNADLTLRKIPEGLSDEAALFVGDILATGYYAALQGGVTAGDVVAVVGCGPVGLFAQMAALRLFGASKVLAIDVVPERLQLAEKLGATPVNADEVDPLDVVLDLTDWRGADVVIEAVGSPDALASAFRLPRPSGTVSVVGVFNDDEVPFPIGDLWLKNVSVKMGLCNVQKHMDELIPLVAAGILDPTVIISHTLRLEEAPKGYELFDAREATKVLLKS